MAPLRTVMRGMPATPPSSGDRLERDVRGRAPLEVSGKYQQMEAENCGCAGIRASAAIIGVIQTRNWVHMLDSESEHVGTRGAVQSP